MEIHTRDTDSRTLCMEQVYIFLRISHLKEISILGILVDKAFCYIKTENNLKEIFSIEVPMDKEHLYHLTEWFIPEDLNMDISMERES